MSNINVWLHHLRNKWMPEPAVLVYMALVGLGIAMAIFQVV